MLLFIVDDTFMISGKGLLLTPGLGNKFARIRDRLTLVKPDKSVIESSITGIMFNEHRHILVNLTKEDVPIGTEVWLHEDHET